jgi:hypothetical protein
MSTVLAALVVISAVPVIVMLGCTMDMSSSGGTCSHAMEMFSSACGGTYVLSQQAMGVLASGLSTIIFALLAVFMMAVFVMAPAARSRAFVLMPANPPPPPECPLGVRLTL